VEKHVIFPQYRQLTGRKVYYKIESDNEFVELSWIGEKSTQTKILSSQYPTLLRIQEMLNCVPPFDILPTEYEKLFEQKN